MRSASERPGALQWCGASVRGRAHARAGVPGQDAWAGWASRAGGGISVADGVGSRAHARRGARAAGPALREALRAWGRAPGASTDALARLVHLLWGLRVAPYAAAECATTCLFAAARPGGRLLLGGIGDGLAMALRPDGGMAAVGLEPRDFTNQTRALGISRSLVDWRLHEVDFPPGSVALVATDGVSEDLRRERLGDFARHLAAGCAPLRPHARAAMLRRILREWPTRAHTDDLTLAVLWRAAGASDA